MKISIRKGISGVIAVSMLFTTAISPVAFAAPTTTVVVTTAKSKAQTACLKLKNYKKISGNIDALAKLGAAANKAVNAAVKSGTSLKSIAGYNYLTGTRKVLELNAENELLSLVNYNARLVNGVLTDYIPTDELEQLIDMVTAEVKLATDAGVKTKSIKYYSRIAKANKKLKSLALAEEAALDVENQIKDLPAVNALKDADKAKVEAARASYNALTDFRKALIEPVYVTTLGNAEKAIAALPAAFALSDAKLLGASQIQLTFTSDVEVTSATNVANYAFLTSNTVKNVASSVKAKADKNVVTLSFSGDISTVLGMTVGSLFTMNVSNVKGVTGATAELKSFTFTSVKDDIPPSIVSTKYVPGNTIYGSVTAAENKNGLIVVEFSEAIAVMTADANNKIKMYEGNTNQTSAYLSSDELVNYFINGSNAKELIIKLNGTKTIPNGNYALDFVSETVKDLSAAGNINRAASVSLKVENATVVTGITTPKIIQYYNGMDLVDSAIVTSSFKVIAEAGKANKVQLRIVDAAGLDTVSLTTAANYTLGYVDGGVQKNVAGTSVSIESTRPEGTKTVEAVIIITFDSAVTAAVKPTLKVEKIKNIEGRTISDTTLLGASGPLAIYNK